MTRSAIDLPFLSPLAIADTASLRDGVIACNTDGVNRSAIDLPFLSLLAIVDTASLSDGVIACIIHSV